LFNHSIKAGARFYGVNLMSELDVPSENYIDDESGTLYSFPPVGAGPPASWADHTVVVSMNNTAVSKANVTDVGWMG
jgi:hypothetical protein